MTPTPGRDAGRAPADGWCLRRVPPPGRRGCGGDDVGLGRAAAGLGFKQDQPAAPLHQIVRSGALQQRTIALQCRREDRGERWRSPRPGVACSRRAAGSAMVRSAARYDRRIVSGEVSRAASRARVSGSRGADRHDMADREDPGVARDVSSAGPFRSMTTTSWPSRCNWRAEQMPTMPAPTITQRIAIPRLLSSEPRIDGVRKPEAELRHRRDNQQPPE